MSFTTCCVCLELRSLPSTGITRLQRYYEPLRHPRAPGLSLAGVRLVIADHALGLPVFRAHSLCTCCRHYPGAAAGRIFRSFSQPYQPSPKGSSGRPAHLTFRGLLGVHSRYGLHTRAVTVYRDTLSEGFSHFVTSMTAPVASGWSGCRVGLAPTGKRRLFTAHTHSVISPAPIDAVRKVHWLDVGHPSPASITGRGRSPARRSRWQTYDQRCPWLAAAEVAGWESSPPPVKTRT